MADDLRGSPPRQGRLTIYIGAAPGVGKTYKMLQDARVVRSKGFDVVIGLLETHGRQETADQVGDLPIIPRKPVRFEGRIYEEMDVDAILARHPDVVLIDELAHSNVPGASAHPKRYQDVMDILDAGIDVVTTVNIQHLESLHDKVAHITGVKVRERVPDWFIDQAREVKLVDVTPETLQERLVAGKIYAPEKVEAALANFFQLAHLSALRELALLEVADDVDQRLDVQRQLETGATKEEQERILVCVNYRPHSERLIRRGWRIADRLKAKLFVLVVLTQPAGRLTEEEQKDLERIRQLSEQFDATVITETASEHAVGETIVRVADRLKVSQIVIGQPLEARGLLARFKVNPVDYVLENAEFVDLHVVSNSRQDL